MVVCDDCMILAVKSELFVDHRLNKHTKMDLVLWWSHHIAVFRSCPLKVDLAENSNRFSKIEVNLSFSHWFVDKAHNLVIDIKGSSLGISLLAHFDHYVLVLVFVILTTFVLLRWCNICDWLCWHLFIKYVVRKRSEIGQKLLNCCEALIVLCLYIFNLKC